MIIADISINKIGYDIILFRHNYACPGTLLRNVYIIIKNANHINMSCSLSFEQRRHVPLENDVKLNEITSQKSIRYQI